MTGSPDYVLPARSGAASGGGLAWLLTAGALLTGIALARAIDWRGHAHPRL